MHRLPIRLATLSVILVAAQLSAAGKPITPPVGGIETADGSITGTIKFDGKAPKLRTVKMGADPVCVGLHSGPVSAESPAVVNPNGTLRYVMVSIQEGLKGTFQVSADTVVLDQKGCSYDPHVWGVMAGQPVRILNSDPTLHNIHSLSKVNRQFNWAMPKVLKKKDHAFKESEEVFAIKCDVHPWMRCWVGVFSHPFYSVSDEMGSFSLSGVPPGTYTIRAWHERLPSQTQTVTVKEGETATLDFTFAPPQRKKSK